MISYYETLLQTWVVITLIHMDIRFMKFINIVK